MTDLRHNTIDLLNNEIEFVLDKEGLLALLHCSAESKPFRRSLQLLAEAKPYLKPAFAVRCFPAGELTENGISVGGRELKSKIVANKLAHAEHVYAYIATCCRGIEQLIDRTPKTTDKYLLDQLAYLAYLQAMETFTIEVEKVFAIPRQVRLCPGSVLDWPVEETKKIFSMLDGLVEQLDVAINDRGLILPLKTTVGVFCASDEEFESCEICPRAKCPTRRSAFNPELQEKMINL